MGDDVGTTYFSYRGPSPSPLDNISNHQGNRSTVRSLHSNISDRGDNNEITTLTLRPYQSNVPDPSSLVLVSAPYPSFYHQHPPRYDNACLAPPYTPFDSIKRGGFDDADWKVHPDFTKGTENLRQCVLFMGIAFLLAFGVTIFMAVYYGNNYSESSG